MLRENTTMHDPSGGDIYIDNDIKKSKSLKNTWKLDGDGRFQYRCGNIVLYIAQ